MTSKWLDWMIFEVFSALVLWTQILYLLPLSGKHWLLNPCHCWSAASRASRGDGWMESGVTWGFWGWPRAGVRLWANSWGLCCSWLHLGASLLLLLFSLISTQQVCVLGMRVFRNGFVEHCCPWCLKWTFNLCSNRGRVFIFFLCRLCLAWLILAYEDFSVP